MIPLATTTITIKGRRTGEVIDPDASGYDPAPSDPTIIASGVRATISLPTFKRVLPSDGQIDKWTLRCDPVDLTRFDTVVDETTGTEYEVDSVGDSDVAAFGLAHTVAFIKVVRGVANNDGDAA